MNAKFSFLSLLLIVLFSTHISLANESAVVLARKAVSEDPAEASAAIHDLRALGPAGLEALMTEYAAIINHRVKDPVIGTTPEWERLTHALDLVGQQKNNFISGLYWYTDLEDAKKAARESNKPILSLRLLGNLSDELSCANSRFFRTVLYPNAQIREILRNRFVLHWKSVRPAPRITVDFGDGRKLERTVAGNSIHYILDSNGQLIDAVPGLYGPAAFKRELEAAESILRSLAGKSGWQRESFLQQYYSGRRNAISNAWFADARQFGDKLPQRLLVPPSQRDALSIGPVAVTKMSTENPMVRAISSASDALGRLTDEEAWRLIARLHQHDSLLDERSVSLIKRQNRSLSNAETYRMLLRFQESIAMDTVRNDYILRPTLYGWLSGADNRVDLEKFNELVYGNLFLTPGSDPWLGLLSPDIYVAVDNGGAVKGR